MSSLDRSGSERPPTGGTLPLARQFSRAAFWNTLLLPVIAALNLAFAILIRRWFGLFSGVYDVLVGVMAALQQYSSVGIPAGLSKFLPEVDASSGPAGVRRFLRQAVTIRVLLLGLLLIPLNVFAVPISRSFGLGVDGPTYLGVLSGLAFGRVVVDLTLKTLQAFFAQFWANLLTVMQGALDLLLVGVVLLLGYEMGGLLGALLISSLVAAICGTGVATWLLRRPVVVDRPDDEPRFSGRGFWLEGQGIRFFRFSGFTYVFGLTGFFTGIGFAAPVLAIVLTPEQVALFATAFKLTHTTVALVVASFRGLYQPLFARLRIRGDPEQLRQAFVGVSKAQLVVLLPAGAGLLVMSGDYVPLLFGPEFQPVVAIAWVLVPLMYAATIFNLPRIILMVGEQYRALVWTQAIGIVAAPVFVVAAASNGLVAAAMVLGGSSLARALGAYVLCRRAYGVRFPWAFAVRIGMVSLVMATALAATRAIWATSLFEAITLTLAGAIVYGVGLRLVGALGPEEIDLLKRSELPGHTWVVAWLTPGAGRVRGR